MSLQGVGGGRKGEGLGDGKRVCLKFQGGLPKRAKNGVAGNHVVYLLSQQCLAENS